jgi:hypothetical protein
VDCILSLSLSSTGK